MKYAFAIILLVSATTAFAQQQTAKVIFYSDPKLLSGIPGFNIYARDTDLGRLERNVVISFTSQPGSMTFRAKTEKEQSMELEMTADNSYYIEVGVKIGPDGGQPKFRQVTIDEGRSAISNIKDRRTINARIPTAEELQAKVIVYRNPKLQSGIPAFDVFVGDKNLGPIGSKSVTSYSVAPGITTIHAKAEQEGSMELDLKQKTTYFVEVGAEIGSAGGRPTFREVSEKDATVAIRTIDPKALSQVSKASNSSKEDEFGIKVGMNSSSFSASINSVSSSVTGFHIGMYYKTRIDDGFYFRPELYYSSQGQTDDYRLGPNGPSIGSTTTTVNYLNIPLLFEAGKRVAFQFGPQFGLASSGREKGKVDGTNVDDDLKNILKSDISLVAGLGASPAKNFHLGVRYNFGLTNIFSKPTGAPADYPDIKNRVVHIYAAVSF